MKAILIDPIAETITEVETTGLLDDLQRLTDCQTISVSGIGGGVYAVLDDEGLLHGPTRLFHFKGSKSLWAGKMLLTGLDLDGNTAPVPLHIEDVTSRIVFLGDDTGAEEAIKAGIVSRPVVAVNEEVVWEWTPGQSEANEKQENQI